MEGKFELEWFGPEPDRTTSVKWYGVTDISMLYAVAAHSPEEALEHLNKWKIEETGWDLMMPMISEYDDEIRSELRERYGERLIVNLIPFSVVEYPENIHEMTDEQRAAFDKLK